MPPLGTGQINPTDLESLISAETSSATSLTKIPPTQHRAWHWSVGIAFVGQKKSDKLSDLKKKKKNTCADNSNLLVLEYQT